ncbi:hypothetical protein CHU92_08390 [Flavobacterium cyanobacteriorum]|uniref:Uncharacterized protein n=1 Tax=Flavobacterium cyanobacteriorum TaxID=2022802 RepID=A0A255Z8W1_9FLAO|nr:hypothetical protein [Flavobacterium cyanobacteriorum]OYQ37344.1 hypothetical protein CHU92_08390 [Flavobacterium cyanobacteriorum]
MEENTTSGLSGAIYPDTTNQEPGSRSPWLAYEPDPAVINPDELATFPKNVNKEVYVHGHTSLHHGKSTPVREGRNIIRTDTNPDKNGFM